MAHRVTMSKLRRFMACPGSESVPHVTTPPEEDAERGNAIHDFVLLDKEPPEAFREECRTLDVSAAPEGQTEIAYAYDWRNDSARYLGRALNREYPPGDELCGTADWVRLDAESVTVWDLKTGRTTHEEARWQLVALALAASRAHGRDSAVIGLVHVIDGALVRGRAETLGPIELAAAAVEIEAAFSAPPTLDVVAGTHCRHCPAFAACPAKAGLARIVAGLPELVLNDETVPHILDTCKTVKRLADAAERAAREYVKHNPIRLADGRVLAMQEVSRTTIDADKAKAVLPHAVWSAAVERSMTKTALDAALREVAADKGQAYAELLAAGALRTSTHLELKRVKPSAVALPEGDEAAP